MLVTADTAVTVSCQLTMRRLSKSWKGQTLRSSTPTSKRRWPGLSLLEQLPAKTVCRGALQIISVLRTYLIERAACRVFSARPSSDAMDRKYEREHAPAAVQDRRKPATPEPVTRCLEMGKLCHVSNRCNLNRHRIVELLSMQLLMMPRSFDL